MAIRTVAIQGFPAASWLGMLDRLNSLPFAVRLSHRVIPLDQATAARLIRRAQVQWFMKRQGAADLVRGAVARQRQAQTAEQEADARLFQDQDASRMAADAAAAAGENASGLLVAWSRLIFPDGKWPPRRPPLAPHPAAPSPPRWP